MFVTLNFMYVHSIGKEERDGRQQRERERDEFSLCLNV